MSPDAVGLERARPARGVPRSVTRIIVRRRPPARYSSQQEDETSEHESFTPDSIHGFFLLGGLAAVPVQKPTVAQYT